MLSGLGKGELSITRKEVPLRIMLYWLQIVEFTKLTRGGAHSYHPVSLDSYTPSLLKIWG